MQILTGPEICDGCDKKSSLVAEYTLETFNDPELFRICATCLQAALDALREADDQALELYVDGLRHDAEREAEECPTP